MPALNLLPYKKRSASELVRNSNVNQFNCAQPLGMQGQHRIMITPPPEMSPIVYHRHRQSNDGTWLQFLSNGALLGGFGGALLTWTLWAWSRQVETGVGAYQALGLGAYLALYHGMSLAILDVFYDTKKPAMELTKCLGVTLRSIVRLLD